MWLEIDAGNTRIKWRLSEGLELPDLKTLGKGAVTVVESVRHSLLELTREISGSSIGKVRRVLVSNVRGVDFATELRHWSLKEYDVEPEFAVSRGRCLGVTNGYESPERLGVDRWLGIIAGYSKTHSPCCIVDFGTTITVDIVDGHGVHAGGYIVPGLRMMKDSLSKKSAVLQSGSPAMKGLVPGRTTEEAIGHGILAMTVGLLELLVRADFIAASQCQWLFTGGDAELMAAVLPFGSHLEEFLVLDGLRLYFSDERMISL